MKYALVLARQRSGTGAFGSVLDKHPELKYLGEVFHPSNAGQENNFFTFYVRHIEEYPNDALPDRRFALFELFLEEQSKRYDGRTIVVDVKYRSLHHLNGGWQGLIEKPLLLRKALHNNVPIIHLTRNNMVESFVSGRLAEVNRIWHAEHDAEIRIRSTVIDIRALSEYIVNIQSEVDLVLKWTSRSSNHFTFDYSEMIDKSGNISGDVLGTVQNMLSIREFTDLSPSFKKQAPTKLSESIENFDLVRQSLSGTEYEWML